MIEVKDIGQLRERIDLYSQATAVNSSTGERTQTFSLIGTYWADVQFNSGSETSGGDVAYDVSRIFVTIKYNSSLNDNCIVKWNSRNYDIRFIEFDMQKFFMKLTCESAT